MKSFVLALGALIATQTVQAADIVMLRKVSDKKLEAAARIFNRDCQALLDFASSINFCSVVRAQAVLPDTSNETIRKTLKQLVYRTHRFASMEVDATLTKPNEIRLRNYLRSMVNATIDWDIDADLNEVNSLIHDLQSIAPLAVSSNGTHYHQVSVVHDYGVGNLLSVFNVGTGEFVIYSIMSSE